MPHPVVSEYLMMNKFGITEKTTRKTRIPEFVGGNTCVLSRSSIALRSSLVDKKPGVKPALHQLKKKKKEGESGLPLEEGEGLQDAAAESPGELPPPLRKPLKNLSTTF